MFKKKNLGIDIAIISFITMKLFQLVGNLFGFEDVLFSYDLCIKTETTTLGDWRSHPYNFESRQP